MPRFCTIRSQYKAKRLAVLFTLSLIMPVFTVPLNRGAGEQIVLNQAGSHSPAGLPNENPTPSFWTSSALDANPLASEGSEGPLTQDADICIIGSGITGEFVCASSGWHVSSLIDMRGTRSQCSLSSITSHRKRCIEAR